MATETKKKRHVVRWIFLSLLIAFILFLGIFALIDYSHYARDKSPYRTLFIPRMELADFEITTMTEKKADMIGHVLIHSPLPFNLRADSLDYQIYIGGVEVIKSTYKQSINIIKWDSTWIKLPVTTYTEKLLTVLKTAEKEGKDSIEYEVKTSFGTNLIGHRHFDLDLKKRLPVFYIPEVKMDTLMYDSLGADGVTLVIPATIINKNKMGFKVKDIDFRFKLADNKWVEGKRMGVIDIKQTAATHITIPVRISFKEIGKTILPLLKHGKNTAFKLEISMKMVSDNNALKNSVVLLNKDGALKEITAIAKESKKEAKEKKKEDKEKGIPEPPKEKHKIKILSKKKVDKGKENK